MGEITKIAIFIDFDPLNLKNEKNDIVYHVGNYFSKIKKKLKKSDFDVIMTS